MTEPTYKRIAVATTFSPRFEQVLAEAKRVRDRLAAELNLIYVGEKNEETTRRFADALAAMQLPPDSRIHYHQGESPADAILEAVHANDIELVIAGALEKEVILRPFLGNVARRLVREASASVFLFTKPEREPKPLRRIVFFVADYSDHTRCALRVAAQLAEKENSETLYVIRVYTTFDAARARASQSEPSESQTRTFDQEEEALVQFIETTIGDTPTEIEPRCIRGNTGFAASDFVQSVEADLLVVPDPPHTGPELPTHIAWVTDVIPCNLWVIR